MISRNYSNATSSLLSLCSESTLNSWSFQQQNLIVNLATYNDEKLIITIKTDTVQSANLSTNTILNTCMLKITDMHEMLETSNGYYIPPKRFCDLMKQCESSYSLFYGRNKTFRYHLAFIGSITFLSCPVSSLEHCINWVST